MTSSDERAQIRAWVERQRVLCESERHIDRARERVYASSEAEFAAAMTDYVIARRATPGPYRAAPRLPAEAWTSAFRAGEVSLGHLVVAGRGVPRSALTAVALETDLVERTRVAVERGLPWSTLVEWAIPAPSCDIEALDRADELVAMLRAIQRAPAAREALLASGAFVELERVSESWEEFHGGLFAAAVRRDARETANRERALRRIVTELGDDALTIDDGPRIWDRRPLVAAILAFAGEGEVALWWMLRAHANGAARAAEVRGFASPPASCIGFVKERCSAERWFEFERAAYENMAESDASARRWQGLREWASESFSAECDERAVTAFERDGGLIEADALQDRAHKKRATRAAIDRWNSEWLREIPREWRFVDSPRKWAVARVGCLALSDPECASLAAPVVDRLTSSHACRLDSIDWPWRQLREQVGLARLADRPREPGSAPSEIETVIGLCDIAAKRAIASRLERASAVRFYGIERWIDRDFARRQRSFASMGIEEMMERALRWDDRVVPEVESELLWWALDRWAREGRPSQLEAYYRAIDPCTAHLHDERASAMHDPTDNRWAWDERRLCDWLRSPDANATAAWIVEPGATALAARYGRSPNGRALLKALGDSLAMVVEREPDHPHSAARIAAVWSLWPFASDRALVVFATISDEVGRVVRAALPILRRARGALGTAALAKALGASDDARTICDAVIDFALKTQGTWLDEWLDEWLERVAPGGIDGICWSEWRVRAIERRVAERPTNGTRIWWEMLRTSDEEQRLLAAIERAGAPLPWNPWLVDRDGSRRTREQILAIARDAKEREAQVLECLLSSEERASFVNALLDRWEREMAP